MTTSAADQIRSVLSDQAGCQGCMGQGRSARRSLFNLISLIKRGEAYLVEKKLTVPTRLHSSVDRPVLRLRILLHMLLRSKHQPTEHGRKLTLDTPCSYIFRARSTVLALFCSIPVLLHESRSELGSFLHSARSRRVGSADTMDSVTCHYDSATEAMNQVVCRGRAATGQRNKEPSKLSAGGGKGPAATMRRHAGSDRDLQPRARS